MNSKLLVIGWVVIFFSGCELLKSADTSERKAGIPRNKPICIWQESTEANDCEIEYWLRYWSSIEDMSWPERKKRIDELSGKDDDMLRKVLLSQGKSTPFQDRLRAQGWVESILPKFSQSMRRFISVALYRPSQSLLEMESALVTLSKINTHQSSSIDEQKILLEKQQSQIDQLLNIEASIIQSIEEDK